MSLSCFVIDFSDFKFVFDTENSEFKDLEDRKLKTRTVKGEKSEEYIKVPRYQLCVGTVGDEPAVLCYTGC